MGLIVNGTQVCPLCGKAIRQSDTVVGTALGIVDQTDPLWRFSEATFHLECFDAWEDRHAFRMRMDELAKERLPKA
jgi:hypothetical protein